MKRIIATNTIQTNTTQKIKKFSAEFSAEMFSLVTDNIYKDPVSAVIRELSCNAYDAHVAAGNEDIPFIITIPTQLDNEFRIRDFGTGLLPDEIDQIYTVMFKSTKGDSNDFVGCFGIGSKSPFALTTQFNIESYVNGTKWVYTVFKDDSGIPSYVSHIPDGEKTDEPNGLMISFGVSPDLSARGANGYTRWVAAAQDILPVFKVKPKCNVRFDLLDDATLFESIPMTLNGSDVTVELYCGNNAFRSKISDLSIEMGNVVYPVNYASNSSYRSQGGLNLALASHRFFNILEKKKEHKGHYEFFVVIRADIGAFQPTASREEISLSDEKSKEIARDIQDKMIEICFGYLYGMTNSDSKKSIADTMAIINGVVKVKEMKDIDFWDFFKDQESLNRFPILKALDHGSDIEPPNHFGPNLLSKFLKIKEREDHPHDITDAYKIYPKDKPLPLEHLYEGGRFRIWIKHINGFGRFRGELDMNPDQFFSILIGNYTRMRNLKVYYLGERKVSQSRLRQYALENKNTPGIPEDLQTYFYWGDKDTLVKISKEYGFDVEDLIIERTPKDANGKSLPSTHLEGVYIFNGSSYQKMSISVYQDEQFVYYHKCKGWDLSEFSKINSRHAQLMMFLNHDNSFNNRHFRVGYGYQKHNLVFVSDESIIKPTWVEINDSYALDVINYFSHILVDEIWNYVDDYYGNILFKRLMSHITKIMYRGSRMSFGAFFNWLEEIGISVGKDDYIEFIEDVSSGISHREEMINYCKENDLIVRNYISIYSAKIGQFSDMVNNYNLFDQLNEEAILKRLEAYVDKDKKFSLLLKLYALEINPEEAKELKELFV